MGLCVSIAAAVIATTSFVSPEVTHFPGSYFEAKAKGTLQQRAMDRWPGPAQAVDRWQSGDLDLRKKIAILVGMSASHDPALLPLYREAVTSANRRLRMAAAYGYRDLLGDALPDLTNGITPQNAEQLAREMDAVARTLRERPLVEFWLEALLMDEGTSMPGWRGAFLRRPQSTCLRAVEKVMVLDDFGYLATAFRLSEKKGTRISLMRLIEAITLRQFFEKPTGARSGWGTQEVNAALEAADIFVGNWLDHQCTTDPDLVLLDAMKTMGVQGVRPLAPNSYEFWLQLLKRGRPPWRVTAARRLYELGGRWPQLSVFQLESDEQTEALEELVRWYRLLPSQRVNRSP